MRVMDSEDVLAGDARQSISAVTTGGPGLVAVGVDGLDGAVWTSSDGLAWSRVNDDSGVFSGDSGIELDGVAAGDTGMVAVGIDGIGAAAWASPDGSTWTRVSDDAAFDESGAIYDVVAGGPGFVAVGTDKYDDGSAAVVWTSADGLAWTRVPDTAETYTPRTHSKMRAVTVGGPGLVAVGFEADGDWAAAVWTSSDGLTWTRVPNDEAIFDGVEDQMMEAVTAGGPGFVAVGQDYGSDDVGAAVWTSTDGFTWTRIPANLDTFGGSQARGMWGVMADGSGLVAVGAVGSGSAIWTSPDGSVWTRVPQNDGSFDKDGGAMFDVIQGGPGLIAVGQEYSGSDPDAAVWAKAASD